MTKKKSLEELFEDLKPYKKYKNRLVRHIKTDTVYFISSIHYKESDLSIWFTYEPLGEYPVEFSRPIEELTDGRFEFT